MKKLYIWKSTYLDKSTCGVFSSGYLSPEEICFWLHRWISKSVQDKKNPMHVYVETYVYTNTYT
jgi:hypothetical protein